MVIDFDGGKGEGGGCIIELIRLFVPFCYFFLQLPRLMID